MYKEFCLGGTILSLAYLSDFNISNFFHFNTTLKKSLYIIYLMHFRLNIYAGSCSHSGAFAHITPHPLGMDGPVV